ncbi:MAG: hypothetical protein Q4D71_05145 [Oscillospiraceae bacterium]|nr:hypothetical protein [Oscillospiraceae bacterium]
MKRFFLIFITLAVILALSGCSGENNTSDDPSKVKLSAFADEDGFSLTLQELEVKNGYIRVKAVFALDADMEGSYFPDDAFTIKAYQGNTELTDISDSTGSIQSRTKAIKKNEMIGITYDFQISSNKSSFSILILRNDIDETELAREKINVSKNVLT